MIQILAIIFIVLWLGFTIFYAMSDDWFGTDGWLAKTLGAASWACLTAFGIYCIGFVLVLLISLAIGIA